MRISDWSSDVCSSDLDQRAAFAQRSFRAVAVANLREIALQARALAGLAAEQLLQVAALLLQRVLLAAQLHFLELAQTAQPHVEDRLGLAVGEVELGDHHRLGLVLGDRKSPRLN